jgi:FKBP-type peptidyl-prolyl cis-trans isomerase 2
MELGKFVRLEYTDSALQEMKPGDKKSLDIPPEEAFGPRRADRIKFFKLGQFRKEGVRPHPGMRLTIDGRMATVKSVSSGRVVVDFNHPLAGLTLHYDLELAGEVTDGLEQARELVRFHLGREVPVEEDGESLVVKGVPEFAQDLVSRELEEYTPFKNTRFVTLEGEDYEEHSQGGKEEG